MEYNEVQQLVSPAFPQAGAAFDFWAAQRTGEGHEMSRDTRTKHSRADVMYSVGGTDTCFHGGTGTIVPQKNTNICFSGLKKKLERQ